MLEKQKDSFEENSLIENLPVNEDAETLSRRSEKPLSVSVFLKSLLKFSLPSVINFLLNMAFIIILTRIFSNEKQEVYGSIDIFNTAVAFIMSLATLGLDSAFIKFFHEPPKGIARKKLFKISIIIPMLLIVLSGTIIILFFSESFSLAIFSQASRVVVLLLFSSVLSQLAVRYFTVVFRMDNRPLPFAILSITSHVATKGFVLVAAFFTDSFEIILLFNTIGIILVAVCFFIFQYKNLLNPKSPTIDNSNKMKDFVLFSIFSWPIATVVYFNPFIARIVIESVYGLDEVAVYAGTTVFVGLFAVVVTGFSSYWSGFMYANYHKEQRKITEVHGYVLLLGLFLFAGLTIFKDIVYFLVGSDYHASKQYFAFSIIPSVLTLYAETTQYGVALKNKAYLSLIFYIVMAVINVGLCYLLIPFFGSSGVAMASAISGLVLFILSTIFGQIYYKSMKKKWRTCLTILCLFLISIINYFAYETIWSSVVVASLFLISILMFIKEIKRIFTIIYNKLKKKKRGKIS